ncbi:tRNA pseudouridine(38-40) synthase TruA [Pelagibacteraceae bacterium]|jgi:tRNA pseudouridine38-40 synthase|nr:tRNA pseudouridine(38-40) synthase TruA [Pelagibacteraceae bacterium]
MMQTYQILVEYDGTKFVGWQIQKNGNSVQETIQKILKKLIKKKILLVGSGRTDAGVHAIEQSAHFKTNYKIKDERNFIKSLNFFLSKYDVSILKIKKKSNNFHSRFSAKKRTYKYLIINREAPLILEKTRAWSLRKKLDINLMKKGADILRKNKDFSTFRSSSCSAKSPIKTLEKVKIIKLKNRIEILFVSQSFLQNQVRSMVGCLKLLGEKKWTISKFKQVTKSKKRVNCAPPAPAHGLYLTKINY